MKYSIEVSTLQRLYEAEKLTLRQGADQVGIPANTVGRYLKMAGVSLRNPGYEKNESFDDVELLKRLYLDERKSTTQIAEIVGSSVTSVSKWLRAHSIPTRSTGSERNHKRNDDSSRAKMSAAKRDRYKGSENPNWRGGTMFRDPERNRYRSKMWVKAVKDRDGWMCTECPSAEGLHAHHIKRWRDYPELRYELTNGVTLCHSCHERAHGRGFKFRWLHVRRTAQECTAPAMQGEDIV